MLNMVNYWLMRRNTMRVFDARKLEWTWVWVWTSTPPISPQKKFMFLLRLVLAGSLY